VTHSTERTFYCESLAETMEAPKPTSASTSTSKGNNSLFEKMRLRLRLSLQRNCAPGTHNQQR